MGDEEMIRNIVFDMGNVMIKWDPERYVARTGVTDPEDQRLLFEATYGSPEWVLLDNGTVSEEDICKNAARLLPERLHKYIPELVYGWHEPVDPIEGMAEFVADCKKAGYGIYLLSNASFLQKTYWHTIPGSALFDGRIVSAEVGYMKPDPGIYRCLLETYGLKAEECLFMDDLACNVIGAMELGLHGYMFDRDVGKLRRIVRLMGVEI